MWKSTTILALLGVTLLGSQTTQASGQLSDLEEILMQDFQDMEYNEDEVELNSIDRRSKELIAQISKVIETDSYVYRKLIKESIKVQKKKMPHMKEGHLKDLHDEYHTIVLKLQHQIMNMSASSAKFGEYLGMAMRNLNSVADSTKSEQVRTKFVSVIFTRLQTVIESVETQTRKFEHSEALKELKQFTHKLKNSKFEEKPLVSLEMQMAKYQTIFEEVKEKFIKTKKIVRSLTDDISKGFTQPNKDNLLAACHADVPGNTFKCADAQQAYIQAEKEAVQEYLTSQDKYFSMIASQKKALTNQAHQISVASQKLKAKELELKKYHIDKKAFHQVLAEMVAVTKETHDLKTLIKYSKVSDKVMSDIQNLRDKKQSTDKIDVSTEEYKKIQYFGKNTADLFEADYFNTIQESLKRSQIEFVCAQKEVDIMVAKSSGHTPKALPKECNKK